MLEGGLRVDFGDRSVDMSVASRVQKLNALLRGAYVADSATPTLQMPSNATVAPAPSHSTPIRGFQPSPAISAALSLRRAAST